MGGAAAHVTRLALEVGERRLLGEDVARAWGSAAGGSPAVSGPDEDAVTLGVAAAMRLELDAQPDVVIAAVPSPPRTRVSPAATMVAALDLPRDVHTVDLAGGQAAAVAALRQAVVEVRAGAGGVLVVCADTPAMPPGGQGELGWGHGAFAALVSTTPGVAEVLAVAASCDPTPDWFEDERGVVLDTGERRLAVSVLPPLAERVTADVLERTDLAPDAVATVAVAMPSAKHARRLGATVSSATPTSDAAWEQGFLGAAMPGRLLAQAHHDVDRGGVVLLLVPGAGVSAALLRLGARSPVLPVPEDRRPLAYAEALRRRGLLARPVPQPAASPITAWREQDALLRLHGVRCGSCGQARFPAGGACHACGSTERGEAVRLVGDATVVTSTRDHLVAHVNPGTPESPTTMAVLETSEAARLYLPVVDGRDVAIGDVVRPVLRVAHHGGGWPNYHWKAAPVRSRP